MLGAEEPGIEDGEVGWNDGEEEEKETDDLGDVKGVVRIENKGQGDQTNDGEADDDAGDGFGPWLVSVGKLWEWVRKHLGCSFRSWRSCEPPVFLDASSGCAGYQYGSVGCAEAVVYIYYGNVGGT